MKLKCKDKNRSVILEIRFTDLQLLCKFAVNVSK